MKRKLHISVGLRLNDEDDKKDVSKWRSSMKFDDQIKE